MARKEKRARRSASEEDSPKPSLWAKWAEFVKLSHTVLALPFAIAATVLAARAAHGEQVGVTALKLGWPGWQLAGLILLAMITARTCAMAFNRIVDRKFDAANPRTKNRHLPAGKISLGSAWALCLLSGALFVGAAYGIDWVRAGDHSELTCLILSPVALVFILGYSLTKRFTDCTHVFLGIALGLAPLGAWLAVHGSLNFGGPIKFSAAVPVLLSVIVVLWLIGFDIIYAIQDFEFDRDHKLHSIVVRWGPDNALNASLFVHFAMLALLAAFGLAAAFKLAYWIGLLIISVCVIVEHWIARRRGLDWVQKAFFNLNAIISIVFMIMVITEVSLVPRFVQYRM